MGLWEQMNLNARQADSNKHKCRPILLPATKTHGTQAFPTALQGLT
jgi:hypothetical protein